MSEVPLYFAYRRRHPIQEIFHSHLGIEVQLIHQGEGSLIINNRRYAIQPGMLCIFQPYQLHRLQLDYSNHTPYERSVAVFEPNMFESYFEQWPNLHAFFYQIYLGRPTVPYICGLEESDKITSVFQSLHERLPGLYGALMLEEISLFLINLFHCIKSTWRKQALLANPVQTRRSHHVEHMLNWIEHHYQEPFRLKAMAEELHLSSYYLSHLFKEMIGTSITEYITVRRMHHAAFLLTSTNKPISLIAQEVGIGNNSYFCKLFKSRMGTTPHQYRKSWLQSH